MAKNKNIKSIVSQFDTVNIDADDIDVTRDLPEIPDGSMQPPELMDTLIPRDKNSKSRNRPDDEEGEQLVIPKEIGIVALRNVVVFPGTVMPLSIGRPHSQRLLSVLLGSESTTESPSETQKNPDRILGVITQRDPQQNTPDFEDLYAVGTIVVVLKRLKMPSGQSSVVVHGLVRFRVLEWLSKEPFLRARIEVLPSDSRAGKYTAPFPKDLAALITHVRQMAQKMVELSPNIPDEVQLVLSNIEDPGALADFLAANINIHVPDKQELLETIDVAKRLKKLSVALVSQIQLLELSAKIQKEVSQSIDKTQREYFLQEQLKAIQTELGQTDQRTAELQQLKDKINAAGMPEKVQAEAYRELDRLGKIPTMSPEYSVSRNYLEWLCELPWSKGTEDKHDFARARRILNTDHYDLAKVKKRVLEFLAVRKLNPTGRSPILCLVGPPGVGKTSLGKSIARCMGRKFIRISLGGIRDEADIRGHRRTYIGALPGRIIQEMRKCGHNNPVFMLDELDKIGQDFRGDPASALLEVLDPEQNNTFTDHFIDQPFDLSRVMFIGTANYMGPVPPALKDRMEVLELPGYTAQEKLLIAQRYLVPRQLQENGLTKYTLKIKEDALKSLIRSYTREAGVREMERQIAAICRAIAADIASNKRKRAVITARHLGKLLGPPRYESELALRSGMPGVATGLAYTPVGGEILFIEATMMPGRGQLILTGQMGDVMKESAQTALSVLKSLALSKNKSKGNGILTRLGKTLADERTFSKNDIHIHVPAGAVPKDGPSAGLAMYTAVASLLANQSIRPDVAMTGEITLRGLILPIGGVKEKLLAAKQAGIHTVILPERNRKDLASLGKEVMEGIKFKFVRNADKVLNIVLEDK